MKPLILLLLAFIFSNIEARFAQPSWPDITLAMLFALFFHYDMGMDLLLALFFGIIRDGLNPSLTWISPLSFVLLAFAIQAIKRYINISLWPILLIFFWAFDLLYRIFVFSIYGATLNWSVMTISILGTGILAILLTRWLWK